MFHPQPFNRTISTVYLITVSLPLLALGACPTKPNMPIYNKLPGDLQEVDVVIAGGGTAGLIVAARISDADPELSILVVEAGQNNYQNPSIIHPALFLGALAPGSSTVVIYQGNSEPAVGGRQLIVPTGAVLGGGSSINIMMYSRAQRSDFNAWNAPGWTADEVLPFMNKLETYYGQGTPGRHGTEGPVQISRGTYNAQRPEDDFIQAAARVGWPEKPDLQDLDSNNGVQRAMRFIGPNGLRQDTAHTYLHPRLLDKKHPNLHVLVEHQITKVLLEGQKAVGVEFRPNPLFQEPGGIQIVRARQMVVLSSGALGTPSILERSGIGHADVLREAGIRPIINLTGVGNNYQDHHLISYSYQTTLLPNETVDGIINGRVNVTDLIANKSSILGWNAQDITCKLRPSESDVSKLSPEFQAIWEKDFQNQLDKPLVLMAPINGFPGDPTTIDPGQYFSLSVFSVYPYSRGSFHIKGPNIDDGVNFTTGFLADAKDVDIQKHIWAYKKQREIMRRMKTYRGEVASTHPPFPSNSSAVVVSVDAPLPEDVYDITYTKEDDAIIAKFIRGTVGTTWHSLGTCKMAPCEEGGVVDERLGVHGISGLKIAGMSIPPRNVAANTAHTAMTIGERAAAIFIKELQI